LTFSKTISLLVLELVPALEPQLHPLLDPNRAVEPGGRRHDLALLVEATKV
jgi:hypothetical protein